MGEVVLGRERALLLHHTRPWSSKALHRSPLHTSTARINPQRLHDLATARARHCGGSGLCLDHALYRLRLAALRCAELRAQSAPAELISSGAAPRCALGATASMELHTALLSTKWCVLRVLFLQRLRLPGRSSFLHGWGSLVAALVGVNSLPAHACAAPSRHPGHRERDGCAPCSSRSRSPRRRLIAFARAA